MGAGGVFRLQANPMERDIGQMLCSAGCLVVQVGRERIPRMESGTMAHSMRRERQRDCGYIH